MDSLGTLLMDFLELFGKNLNQQYVGIGLDVDEGGYFFPKRTGGRGGLSVIDPQDSCGSTEPFDLPHPKVTDSSNPQQTT
jgi:DNA polymerase sigma